MGRFDLVESKAVLREFIFCKFLKRTYRWVIEKSGALRHACTCNLWANPALIIIYLHNLQISRPRHRHSWWNIQLHFPTCTRDSFVQGLRSYTQGSMVTFTQAYAKSKLGNSCLSEKHAYERWGTKYDPACDNYHSFSTGNPSLPWEIQFHSPVWPPCCKSSLPHLRPVVHLKLE